MGAKQAKKQWDAKEEGKERRAAIHIMGQNTQPNIWLQVCSYFNVKKKVFDSILNPTVLKV